MTQIRTRLTDLLGIDLPIIQGGLAYLATAELAAAVSRAGGLGQITAATLGEAQNLRAEIEHLRRLTDRPFGVNFALGHRPLDDHLRVALEEGVPVITVTGGNPEPLFRSIGDRPVKKLVLVASVRQAKKSEQLGADAVIAVGQEGGGHLGKDDVGTLVLVPRVVDEVDIPVVASGGIADGRGLAAALCLGAEGVEMGTRFVATAECAAHPGYKQALLRAQETETQIIERSLGRPGRALRSAFTEHIAAREEAGAGFEELFPLISGQTNRRAAVEGQLDQGFVWAGQSAGLIRDVPTVADLFERMVREARQALARAGGAMAAGFG